MTTDFAVVGGGVVGLTVALTLRDRHPGASVAVLEKERRCGLHASGRNSGVLHAGFYYSADSLKARFSRDGCARWKEWCAARGLRVNPAGKLVVARSEADHPAMDDLLDRARRNGVELHDVSEAEARDIDPRARTTGRALWSPTTASVDPVEVMAALEAEARDRGVSIHTRTPVVDAQPGELRTPHDTVSAGFVVNAAGLHADTLARQIGFGERYRIVPFKGLYLRGDVPPDWLRVHVYPVPDPRLPFLGVHFTVKVDGAVTIGPTALPALWREQYRGLGGFSARELLDVVGREARLARKPWFRALAVREAPRLSRRMLARRAAGLVHGLDPSRWRRWGRPGIRAQLQDARTGDLVMDFVVEGDDRSMHVLNAVSPAFTCAWPLAEHLADVVG